MHFDRSKLWDFNFLRGLAQGLSGGFSIARYERISRNVNLSALLLRGLKGERCDFQRKNRSGAGAVQNIDSTHVLLLRGTVSSYSTSFEIALKIPILRQKDDNLS